jgi:hypothetical protein
MTHTFADKRCETDRIHRQTANKKSKADVPHQYDVARLDAMDGSRLCEAYLRSKRSRFMTLFQAATKSWRNFSFASFCA